MTLFPRSFEADMGIDTSAGFEGATALVDVEDIISQGVADVIINNQAAPSIITLPEEAKPKIFGDFDQAAQFYDGDEPTYYMG